MTNYDTYQYISTGHLISGEDDEPTELNLDPFPSSFKAIFENYPIESESISLASMALDSTTPMS